MIQLKVYPNADKSRTQQIFLDLYDSEPIKLNLSIEDITDADATSVFSRQFKIPATRNNNLFFKSAFEINGTDYDVTVKKPAEILVDGQEFRQGHIRLQKIYINGDLDKTDYQLLFLGETRDFSTVIGDAPLCQLLMPDLQILDDQTGNYRNPSVADIELSWQAWPQQPGVDSQGNPNTGLSNGNLLFPLIDHGNNYDDTGLVVGSTMQIGSGSIFSFTDPNHPLETSKLKPMIRAKRIMDQIFEDAGYTYTSTFFDSPRFHQMYVSAFGNEAAVGYSVAGSGENLLNAEYLGQTSQHFGDNLFMPDNVYDPGSNYTTGTLNNGSRYTVGADVPAGDPLIKLRIVAEAFVRGLKEISCPTYCVEPVTARLQLVNVSTGQVYKESGSGYNDVVSFTFDSETDGIGVLAGSILALRVTPITDTDEDFVGAPKMQVLNAPGTLLPTSMLDCEYKQIDFVKDILKMFRLVLAPDTNDSKNFIVEPWQTYINSGDLHDWSHKLVNNKDVVLEPLFNTQSEEIEFRMQQDEDWINKFHFDQYKEPYGYLQFDSNNELLKGTRNINTIGIAPTPLGTIQENAVNANHQAPGFIFPQIHVNETEDTGLKHLPIKPKTRLLFYNGLVPVPQPSSGNLRWYLQTNANMYTTYPLVSSFEDWPNQSNALNLNWSNDINYWVQTATTQVFSLDQGGTLYSEYWSRYINSLYNKFSRRLTAYFILNNVDLQTFSFDDTIFVNGKYYRPEKIVDARIGELTEVKVVLITANDYVPPTYVDEQLTNFSLATVGESCGCDGIITVTTDGATPFTWQLSNGQTGQAATTGGNPQQFDIDGICAGAYNVTIIDDLGRSNSGSAVVSENTNPPISATITYVDDTSCGAGGNCTGEATVTASGGSGGPYVITWQYGQPGPTIGPTLTGQCGESIQPFTVTDSSGCLQGGFEAVIPCGTPVYLHKLAKNINNCTQSSSAFIWAESQTQYQAGTTVDVNEFAGCYYVVDNSQGTPTATIANTYTDCADCASVTPPQIFKAEAVCDETNIAAPKYIDATTNPGISINSSVKFVNDNICYLVTGIEYSTTATSQVDQSFTDCVECAGVSTNKYFVEGCNGFDPTAPPPTGGTIPFNGFVAADVEYAIAPMYTSDVNLGSSTNGVICERQVLWATGTEADGTSTPPAGWYWFEVQVRFENLVALPSDTVLSLVRINDPVAGGATGLGEIIDVLETYPIQNYGAADQNKFTVNSVASHYLPPNVNQRFGLIIHRGDGQACVQGGGTNSDFAILNDLPGSAGQDFSNAIPWWLGDFSPNVVEANGTLNIGDVITVNESDAQGCYEVIGVSDPNNTADLTYNEDNGIYENCASCTGGITQQSCHTVTASATGAEISWYYDDGGACLGCVGLSQQTLALSGNQVVTICAQTNSIVTVSGSIASSIDSGTICSRYVDPISGVVGTTCDTPTVASRYCYTVTGTGLNGTFAIISWIEDATFRSAKLKTGDILLICANLNSVLVVSGYATVVGGTTACTSTADCVTACYKYAYDGPKKQDLLFINCDGDKVYYSDVYEVSYTEPNNVLPACIAEVLEGSAAPFLTQYTTCV